VDAQDVTRAAKTFEAFLRGGEVSAEVFNLSK
jgi:hypothetical protein